MKYRPDIDGLRAIAILAVMFYHAGFSFIPGGFIGVDIFFVISGFLITGIVYREICVERFSMLNFYERRIRRIFPALFVMCLTVIPFSMYFLAPIGVKKFSESLIGAAGSVSNFIFWREADYFDTSSDLKPLIHTWSLGVEEQFYMVFPALLLLMWKVRRHWVLGSVIVVSALSLAASDYFSRHYTEMNFYLLPSRMWELMAGGIVAILLEKHKGRVFSSAIVNNAVSLASLMVIAASLYMIDETTRFPSLYAAVPVYATALLLMTAHHQSWAGRLLSLRPMIWIGLASYSIYLWHQPVLVFTRIYLGVDHLPLLIAALCLLLSTGLGFLSLWLVERPFRNRNFLSTRSVFMLGVGSMVFLILCGWGVMALSKYHTSRNPEIRKINEYAVNLEAQYRQCPDAVHGFCVIGDKSKMPKTVIWGDSHAGAIAPGLDSILKERGKSAYAMTFGGCPPLIGKIRMINGVVDDRCVKAMSRFLTNLPLIGQDVDTIILSMRWSRHLTPSSFDNHEGGVEKLNNRIEIIDIKDSQMRPLSQAQIIQSVRDTVTYFKKSGLRVVVVYPIPEMGWDVPQHLIKQIRSGEKPDGSISYKVFKDYNALSFRILDDLKEVERIYPDKLLCNSFIEGRCAAVTADGIPLYFDDDHISPYAAKMVAKKIDPLLH